MLNEKIKKRMEEDAKIDTKNLELTLELCAYKEQYWLKLHYELIKKYKKEKRKLNELYKEKYKYYKYDYEMVLDEKAIPRFLNGDNDICAQEEIVDYLKNDADTIELYIKQTLDGKRWNIKQIIEWIKWKGERETL